MASQEYEDDADEDEGEAVVVAVPAAAPPAAAALCGRGYPISSCPVVHPRTRVPVSIGSPVARGPVGVVVMCPMDVCDHHALPAPPERDEDADVAIGNHTWLTSYCINTGLFELVKIQGEFSDIPIPKKSPGATT